MNKETDTIIKQKGALWKALLFIQNNLESDELILENIAERSGFSPFHFHRLFKEFTGETLKSHIRRLRLENAAFRLKTQKEQIIDIALDSGYYTHETFTRAFNKTFGINPSIYKKLNVEKYSDRYIASINKVYFKKRNCIFMRHTGAYELSGTPEKVSSLWHHLMGYLPKDKQKLDELELFGVSHDDPSITNDHHIRYDACIAVPDDIAMKDTSLILPEGIYICAKHKGPFGKLTESYHYLIYNWLTLFNHTMGPNTAPFEKFNITGSIDGYKLKEILIYIPVR